MPRKAIPVRVHVDVAIQQAWDSHLAGHAFFACPLCNGALHEDERRILEHMTPHAIRRALDLDPDAVENLRFVHATCAALKTNGTKATCASGDTHKIAKAKRLATARAVHDAVKRGEHVRTASRIKNAGFRQWRKFNGDAVRK